MPGAQVVTSSGLHATVTEVDEDGTVLLQTAPGQVTRWEKAGCLPRSSPAPRTRVVEDGPPSRPNRASRARRREPVEPPAATESPRPAGEPSTYPAPEPGARPLPDTAPPDRA